MNLEKIKPIDTVSLKFRKGRKVVGSRKASLSNFIESITVRLGLDKAKEAEAALLEGRKFQFKLDDHGVTVLPLLPR